MIIAIILRNVSTTKQGAGKDWISKMHSAMRTENSNLRVFLHSSHKTILSTFPVNSLPENLIENSAEELPSRIGSSK